MPAIHSKLSEKGVAKVRHRKLRRYFPYTHIHASLLNNFSLKCPRQTVVNQTPLLAIASPRSNISRMAPQEPPYTLLPKCVYEGRGRGRRNGGSRCG